jgi:hypothetical protein
VIESITYNIEFIDFSTDNNYMMYKDFSGEIVYVALKDGKPVKNINPASVEFTHEWQSDGLSISNKGIEHYYPGNNGIQKLTLIQNKTLLVTDDMGTVSPLPSPPDPPVQLSAHQAAGLLRLLRAASELRDPVRGFEG